LGYDVIDVLLSGFTVMLLMRVMTIMLKSEIFSVCPLYNKPWLKPRALAWPGAQTAHGLAFNSAEP
jgi:hypothetical protein